MPDKPINQIALTGEAKEIRTGESKAINNTRLRRYLVLIAFKLLKRFRPRDGPVLFATNKICIKHGGLLQLSEASTMQFIARHTSVPIPKVYCAFTHKEQTYIAMERIRGEELAKGWRSRSVESKTKILSQLKRMVEEIRRIPPPPGQGVSNVDGGPIRDGRLPGTSVTFGPWETIDDFHQELRNGFTYDPRNLPKVNELIALQERPWPPPVFTHGDLSSWNILVLGDEVVGIIDWETAGWYPSYWEYTNACDVHPFNEFWRDEIDKFLEPMPRELEMEKIRLKHFGDF